MTLLGEIRMQVGKVTLDTIAAQLGITKVSVSKALNNQPGVSEELKRRIVQSARELGYIKKGNVKPAAAVSKLGLIVPKRFFLESDNFYTKIYYYTNQECAKKDISLSLYVLDPEQEKSASLPLSLVQDQSDLDGLFVAGEVEADYMKMLLDCPFPVVVIDFYKAGMTLDCILADNYQAGYTVTNYLIQNGHTRIGFVGNPQFTTSVMDRYCGYIKALTYHQLEINPSWRIVNNDINNSYVMDFQLPAELPTAFVCHCDMAAYKLLLKLQKEGISVPDEVSLISFDNTDLSQSVTPALTSMNISKHDFATEAVHRMLWRIKHDSAHSKTTYLQSKLIERDSVKRM